MRRLGGNKHLVYHMDFFPDSSHFVTIGGKSSALWIWDLRKPDKPEKFQLKKPDPPAKAIMLDGVAVMHDNQIVAALRMANSAQMLAWNLCFVSWPSKEYRSVRAKRSVYGFSAAKGRTALLENSGVIGSNPSPAWWDLQEEQVWESPKFKGAGDVKIVVSDDLKCYAGIDEEYVAVWYPSKKEWSESISFEYGVDNVIFSPSGKYLLVDSVGCYFRVFETATFTPISEEIEFDSTDFATPQFTPDDRKLLFPSQGAVHIVDVQTSEEISSYDFKVGDINALKISDDGLMYAISGEEKEIVIADLE